MSSIPLLTANSAAIFGDDKSAYCNCFISSSQSCRAQLFARRFVQIRSNCANAANSRYCAQPKRTPPPSFLDDFGLRAPPTRDTTNTGIDSQGGCRVDKSLSRNIWPSVMEITLSDEAETSPLVFRSPAMPSRSLFTFSALW